MIKTVTNFGRSGLHDWLIQRVSALVILSYVIHFVLLFALMPNLTYADWVVEFHQTWIKVFTFLFLVSLACHAWIGMWTVFTDYIKETPARLFMQCAVILSLLACVAWGTIIVWSV